MKKIFSLTKDPNSIVVVADNHQRVKFIHSHKKFGGTHTNTAITVGGLMGHGAQAVLVAVDVYNATYSQQVKIPSINKIWRCRNVETLKNLSMANPSNGDKSIEEMLAKLTTSRRSNCSRM
jgi:hypothetical protein